MLLSSGLFFKLRLATTDILVPLGLLELNVVWLVDISKQKYKYQNCIVNDYFSVLYLHIPGLWFVGLIVLALGKRITKMPED